MRSLASVCLLALVLGAGSGPVLSEDENEVALFGFRGLENYKLDRGIFGLRTADVDGDGRRDLLVVNNARARIDVLLRTWTRTVPPMWSTPRRRTR